MKRLVIRITPSGRLWRLHGQGVDTTVAGKRKAVRLWAALLNAFAEAGGLAQLVIHTADGRLEEERTFPRASDPRRTRG